MRILTLVGILLTTSLHSLSESLPDSVLGQMLTRAVYAWQDGRAKDAFFTLDSVIAQPVSIENAGSKVKAALWTSSYLMEQRKIRPAKAFIDSALTWSQRFPMEEEGIRVYQALSNWHVAVGDAAAALHFKDKEWELRDSLSRISYEATIDSLKKVISQPASQAITREEVEPEATTGTNSTSTSSSDGSIWLVILGLVLSAVVVLSLFRRRKTNGSRSSTAPQVSGTPSVPATIAEVRASNPVPVFDFQPSTETPKTQEETDAPAAEPPHPPNRETLARLKGVELVLIRPEVLAAYQNGDIKSIRNLLNEYMAQLPFIMKTLDEAINRNETAPILLSLQHVKSYLKLFGMQTTEKLIGEVESESATEKVSKLLSRVFQVRNHCRRAADEAKSLLEKIG